MSVYKVRPSKKRCSDRIQKYLEGKDGERVVAKNFINLCGQYEEEHWAEVMDETRIANRNDLPWNGKSAITFQHFIISPDPKDNPDPQTLRDIVWNWANEFFGRGKGCLQESGKLGSYQVAIILHDDGTNGILHAHVVVNNTNLITGKRLQISNTDNHALWDRLQDMMMERGWSHFDSMADLQRAHIEKTRRTYSQEREEVWTNRVEERSRLDGAFSWKQDLRNLIFIAKETAIDEDSLLDNLEELGVNAHEVVNDYGMIDFMYTHPKNDEWKITGVNLDRRHCDREHLLFQVEYDNMELHMERDPEVKRAVYAYIVQEFLKEGPTAYIESGVALADVAKCLNFNRAHSIHCMQDYPRYIDQVNKELKRNPDDNDLRELHDEAVGAMNTAKHGAFFQNTVDKGFEDYKKRHAWDFQVPIIRKDEDGATGSHKRSAQKSQNNERVQRKQQERQQSKIR